jgi:TRAP-type transport system periplasmic protein
MHSAVRCRWPLPRSVPRPWPRAMSRRTVLAAAAGLAVPFLPRFARAAEITWRIGHTAPTDFALHVRLLEAAGAIALRSEGQMAVEVYPNSELGSQVGLLAQVRAGTIDAVPLSNQILAKDLPVAALPMLGFAFAGYDELWPAIDGDVGSYLRGQIAARLSLTAMDNCWDFGFRQVTTNGKVINKPEDMQGLRLRTPPEADNIELFQALKALPVAISVGALEQALASHFVDGQESILPLVKAAGLVKVQSVCALTNHVWDGQWLCVSGTSWSKLPPKLKDVVAVALNESARNQRQDIAGAEVKIRTDLEAAGMKFNTVDPSGFRSVLRSSGYYSAWNTKMGDDGWAKLRKYARWL